MRITCANKQQLDEVYIHDALFDGFSYDYERRTIRMVCSKPWEYWRVSLCFENVIFFSHQSCDFWGRGGNVMWLSVVENPEALQKLLAKQAEDPNLYQHSWLDRGIDYLALELVTNSGSELLVICEALEMLEETGVA